MISINDAELRLGGNVIFSELSWRIDIGRRVGLVGPNGAGKSSLLRVLMGEHSLEQGRIEFSKGLRLGYLPQDSPELPKKTVREVLWESFAPLNEMEREMHVLMQTIESTPANHKEHEDAVHRYSELHDAFQHRGGYERESNAKKVLIGLGFETSDWERPASEFSGGWRMRIMLARLLLEQPDIFLLDEPTNHLDPETLSWLEQYLTGLESGLVIVSHDRAFLDRTVQAIGEIDRKRFREYLGNYSEYRRKREEIQLQLIAEKKNQDREIAHLERFVERFKAKNTKASQAQSRMKRLEKIERIELETESGSIHIPMPDIPRSGHEVLTLEGVGHWYGDLHALQPVDAVVYRGDRIAVWGHNGAGKTTLLSIMAKEMEPTEGRVAWGYNTHIAYFSQQQAELQESENSVLDELSASAPPEMQTQLRSVLGAFLFRGDDVFKQVSVLSGGEKSRLALAKLLVKPCNVLIMDEPLNHLDIDTVEKLESTLKEFAGTLIFVSHDRFFADRLAGHIWEMKQGRLKKYKGNYSDYEYTKSLNAPQKAEETESSGKSTSAGSVNNSREARKEQKRREAEERKRQAEAKREKRKKYDEVERKIHDVEAEIEDLETRMASGEFIQKPTELPKINKRYKQLLKDKDKLYKQWEKLVEALG